MPNSLTTQTTYRDFESREHLTSYVEEYVEHALRKFLDRQDARVEVTLGRGRQFEVGVTLKPNHQAPVHVLRVADDLHQAVRAAVHTVEKILRRSHAKQVDRRRRVRRSADVELNTDELLKLR